MSCSLYSWSLVPGIVPGTSKVLKNIGQMYVQKKIRSWAFQINDLFSLNTGILWFKKPRYSSENLHQDIGNVRE